MDFRRPTFSQIQREVKQGAAHRRVEQEMLDNMAKRTSVQIAADDAPVRRPKAPARLLDLLTPQVEIIPPFERMPGETVEVANLRRANELRQWHEQRPVRPPRPPK
jgi:hypothetical protein